MLQFIELTPYDLKQIAKLLSTPVQTWRSYAEDQELKNSRISQQDPCCGAGFSQLMGLPPMEDPQIQACLNSTILTQTKKLGMQALHPT